MLIKNFISVLVPACLSAVVSLTLNLSNLLVNPFWFYSIVYFILFCFISNLIYTLKTSKKNLTGAFLTGITIKLLLAFIIVALYSFLIETSYLAFGIQFTLHYILFTIFEIRYLLQLTKLKNSE
jgi:hypothetical protein